MHHNKIQGSWTSENFTKDLYGSILLFSFEDSLCSYFYELGSFSPYHIIQDTLFIAGNHQHYSRDPKNYKFLIDHLSSDKLIISPSDEITIKEVRSYGEYFFDQHINLKKVSAKNDLKFDRIGFYTTYCYKYCPSMYLELTSGGSLYFYGKRYTDTLGYFTAQLSSKLLEVINRQIHALPLDSIQESYSEGSVDTQTVGVRIQFGEKIIESNVSGLGEEPIELRILFHTLEELYKKVTLKEEYGVSNKFKLQRKVKIGGEFPFPPPRY